MPCNDFCLQAYGKPWSAPVGLFEESKGKLCQGST